jgi:hypothetical protein
MNPGVTTWQGPASGLSVERMCEFGGHSGSSYSVEIGTAGDQRVLLTPEEWADLVTAAAQLGHEFGQMS